MSSILITVLYREVLEILLVDSGIFRGSCVARIKEGFGCIIWKDRILKRSIKMSWYKKAAYQEDYVEEVIIPNEVSRESKDNVLKIKTDDEVAVIEYKKVYAWKNDPGAGFAFPCTPDGEVIEDKMHPSALENLNKCRDNPDDFIVTLEKRIDIERL